MHFGKILKHTFLPHDDLTIIESGKAELNSFGNKPIKIVVWNIYKAKKKGLLEDFKNIIESNDLVLSQEFINSEVIQNTFSIIKRDIVLAISFYNKLKISTGVCTTSAVNHKSKKSIKSQTLEPILKTPKTVLITKYSLDGSNECLTVFNIHGINFVNTQKFENQMMQIDEELNKTEGPIIMAGDFNLWYSKRWKILKNITIKHNLTEILFSNDSRRIKLDRAFSRGGEITNPRILKDFNSSDHKPLYFEFKIS